MASKTEKSSAVVEAVTAARLRSLLRYEPLTGEFFWIEGGRARPAGKRAGHEHNAGYRGIRVDGKAYLAHRLAWLYVHGAWPVNQIDHINGERADNRIANLRECSNAENCQNVRAHRDGAGLIGTSLEKRRGKWQAGIGFGGKRIFLGYFQTREEAHDAYVKAKSQHHSFGAQSV